METCARNNRDTADPALESFVSLPDLWSYDSFIINYQCGCTLSSLRADQYRFLCYL